MKITLMENHTDAGVEYKAGEEIDVDKSTYDFLMTYYMGKREAAANKERAITEALAKPMVFPTKKGSK